MGSTLLMRNGSIIVRGIIVSLSNPDTACAAMSMIPITKATVSRQVQQSFHRQVVVDGRLLRLAPYAEAVYLFSTACFIRERLSLGDIA